MLNGRNHSAARKGLVVNGRSGNAVAEAEASALYGEYEQKLASDLAELLKSGGVASATGALRTSLPSGPPPLGSARTTSPVDGHPSALSPAVSRQPSSRGVARGGQQAFVPAAPPVNDFATPSPDRGPMPFSWRHEPRPAQPSWVARQMRAGLLGLGAGLIVVLPAVAVLSGRLDAMLSSHKPAVSDRAPRLYEVPMAPPKVATMLPVIAMTTPVEQTVVPVPRVETVPTIRHSFEDLAASKPEAPGIPPVASRSFGTVEAFPPAAPVGGTRLASLAPPPAVSSTAPIVDEAKDLLALGQRLVKDGDITGARTPLARAANLGSGEAMLALGETFDPNMLAAWGALDVKSDASSARLFYGRAVGAGQARAKSRLDALN